MYTCIQWYTWKRRRDILMHNAEHDLPRVESVNTNIMEGKCAFPSIQEQGRQYVMYLAHSEKLKLMNYSMKPNENLRFEICLRGLTTNEEQLGFRKGKSTTDAIFSQTAAGEVQREAENYTVLVHSSEMGSIGRMLASQNSPNIQCKSLKVPNPNSYLSS